MKQQDMTYLALFSIIIAMFIWASSFIALKAAIGDMGPFTVIFFRMLIASLCFVYFIKGFIKYTYTKEDIKYILILAIFEPCLYFIFEAKALELTSASQAGMMASTMPLITAVMAGYLLNEIITKKLILGSLIAMVGVIFLSLNASSTVQAPNPLLGNFLEFCAMVCGAGYTIAARYLSSKFSAIFITAIQSFIGAIFFFPLFIYEYNTQEIIFSMNSLLWVLYLGVVVTLGGYGTYNYALTKIDASKAAAFINLIPIFTLILAYVILDDVLTTTQLIASGIILVGVLITQIQEKKEKSLLKVRTTKIII
jgi:drug/metabolite transporter (DMT)-like permease